MTKRPNDQYKMLQREADVKRLNKLIVELEVTARHFKVGTIWNDVMDCRRAMVKYRDKFKDD